MRKRMSVNTVGLRYSLVSNESLSITSNYINFPHCQTAAECWDYSTKVAKEVSKLFPPPISLAYEEKIYWRFMILTKKRYMSLACERDGKVEDKISKKGVLLQRRDNCSFIRKVYGEVVIMIFNKKPKEEVLSYITEELNKVCSGFYPPSEFVVTKSIGDVGNLKPSEGTDKDGKSCMKIGDYKVKQLPNDAKEREKQFAKKDCENEKEYYLKCLPAQVQLAEKMRRRGQLVAAGSRIEYVITSQGGHNAKQYEKVEDIAYFLKHIRVLKLDYLYYVHQISNPLDQILDIIYGKIDDNGRNLKLEFTLNQYKIRYQKTKVLQQLINIFTYKIRFE